MKEYTILLLLFLCPCFVSAQDLVVKGIVLDKNNGEPLIGATVLVKGTTIGVVTDLDGNFSLKVPAKDVQLSISYIGFEAQTVTPVFGKKMKIELGTDAAVALDEVVVVAFGTQKKESMVGSISTVKSKTLTTVPASNLTQSLAGKASGVTIVQSSGEIGRDEADIYIRGKATFANENTKPLIVVDGIIRESFAQIDPNEIESINILKDASATAVYGVKGANGVIIVTTKRGVVGKPEVSITSQVAVNVPIRLYKPLDAYRSALLRNEMLNNGGQQAEYSATDLMKYRTKVSPYTHPDVDWMDEIMKSGSIQQQYNVNVRGGTKSMRYFVSGGFFNQNSPFKGDNITNFNRYNFRSNLDFDITKDLSASINIGARIEDRHYPTSMQYSSWDIYHAAIANSGRKYPAFNMDGSYGGDKDYSNIHALIRDSGEFKENRNVLEAGLNLTYKLSWLLPGLAIRGQVAYDDDSKHGKIYRKEVATYQYLYPTDTYIMHGENRPLRWDWQYVDNFRKIYLEGGLTYEHDFRKHNVSALILFNRLSHGYNVDLPYASQGMVGRFVYGYDTRYLAEVNFGYNGSENFAKGKRYGLFPSFALGWVISNEPFYKKSNISKIMNSLKIRGSLGWVGNDRVWAYDPVANTSTEARFIYLQQYEYVDTSNTDNSYIFGIGDNRVQGIRQGRVANKDVSWETSRKLNIGLEAGLFNNALTFNIDYFHERRSDILTQVQTMPSYVGTVFSPANIGIVQNQGVELEVNHSRFIGPDFSYSIKGNMSFARNKVIDMGTPLGVLLYQRPEGYPIDTPLKLITLGYFQDYDDIERSPSQLALEGNTEVHPGDLKYKDINGDGVIDRADFIRTGYPLVPEIQYGINLSLSYKGFDVGVLFQGSTHVSFDKNWEAMWAFSNGDNVYDKHWSYWTPEMGDANAKYTQMYGKYQNNEAGADYTLSDGSYIRLKNLDIGYTLPKKITEKAFIKTIRIYFSALNLATWAKEPYLDPDNRDNRAANMPPMKAYNFGLNINF